MTSGTGPRTHPVFPGAETALDQHLDLLRALKLDTPDPELDAFATQLASDAGVPYAMVNVLHPITGEQLFVGLHASTSELRPPMGRTMSADQGFCPETARRKEKALVLPDVCSFPRFASNPVVDRLGIRTYAGAALIHPPTGSVLGTVCFVGPTPLEESTGQGSLALIKGRRDALMELIERRARQAPQ